MQKGVKGLVEVGGVGGLRRLKLIVSLSEFAGLPDCWMANILEELALNSVDSSELREM